MHYFIILISEKLHKKDKKTGALCCSYYAISAFYWFFINKHIYEVVCLLPKYLSR